MSSLSISEAFATLPLPHVGVSAEGIAAADRFQEVLTSWSKANRKGMTDAMNAVNAPATTEATTKELRRLLEEIDGAVKAAYGWTDIDLSHAFTSVTRHGISVMAREQLLAALLKLNRERYEVETSTSTMMPRSSKARTKADDGQGALVLIDAPGTEQKTR